MGIDAHGVRFLEYAVRANGPLKSTLTLGRQRLDVSATDLRNYLGTTASGEYHAAKYVDELLVQEFGATSVASIDASGYEQATYVQDLNLDLPPDFPQFDTVIDAGTLEHVFDIRASFGNTARCCRLGGQILHVVPGNNFVGHGFYQFSPEFFFSLYSDARGFADTEVYLADLGRLNFWWKVTPPTGGARSTALSSRETYVLARTRKISEVPAAYPVQQSDYVNTWESHDKGKPTGLVANGRRGILGKLANQLPDQTRAVLASQITPRLAQARRRFSSGLHSGNPALSRVSVPSHRAVH